MPVRLAFALALEPLEGAGPPCRCPRWAGCCTSTGCRRRSFKSNALGQIGRAWPEQVFAHDHHGQPCGADVLLRAAKGQANAAPVHRARGDVGGEINHQRRIAAQGSQVGQFVKLHTVNGFIAANVNVGWALAGQLPALMAAGRVVKPLTLPRGGQVRSGRTWPLLFEGFLAPAAGHDKVHRRQRAKDSWARWRFRPSHRLA